MQRHVKAKRRIKINCHQCFLLVGRQDELLGIAHHLELSSCGAERKVAGEAAGRRTPDNRPFSRIL